MTWQIYLAEEGVQNEGTRIFHYRGYCGGWRDCAAVAVKDVHILSIGDEIDSVVGQMFKGCV